MWQRFGERARRVVFFAQEEAGRLGENYVSTEHVLLGLVREDDSVAARILDTLGVSLNRIRSDIERQVTRGDGRLGQDMQITPRAKRVIDLAYDEARQLSNNYIGTEHLLLGLIREGMDNYGGLNGRVLKSADVELERTRREVMALQDNDSGIASKAEKDNPPNAAQALSSSRVAGRIFNREYEALSAQQQITMQTTGLPMRELSRMMRELLRFTMQTAQNETETDVQTIHHADELMRVRVEMLTDDIRYHVTSDVTLLTTMLVRDDAP